VGEWRAGLPLSTGYRIPPHRSRIWRRPERPPMVAAPHMDKAFAVPSFLPFVVASSVCRCRRYVRL